MFRLRSSIHSKAADSSSSITDSTERLTTSPALSFNYCNLVGRQFVKLIDQLINLAVERGALRLVVVAVAVGARGVELLLGVEHRCDVRHHAVVAGAVGGVG